MKVIKVSDLIESMLKDIEYSADARASGLYPFKVRVACVKRRPPRHPFFEYILDIGRADIESVFSGDPFGKTELTFVFPERWLGVAEQQSFMAYLEKHPEATTLKRVDLVTSSPLLLGNFYAVQMRIVTWEDDDDYKAYAS